MDKNNQTNNVSSGLKDILKSIPKEVLAKVWDKDVINRVKTQFIPENNMRTSVKTTTDVLRASVLVKKNERLKKLTRNNYIFNKS
jgi:hypothetical protein